MGIRSIEGFECGIIPPNTVTGGTFSVQSSIVRSGSYALRFNNTSAQSGFVRFYDFAADGSTFANMAVTASLYLGGYFRYEVGPTGANGRSICSSFVGASANQLRIFLTGAGTLAAYNLTVLLATGTTVLNPSTWYLIEVKATKGTSGAWEVRIDGNSEISGTANFTTGNIDAFVVNSSFTVGSSEAVDWIWDDVVTSDSGYPPTGRVLLSLPNADATSGVNDEWASGTGSSDWNECKELPPDGGTTYVKCTAAVDSRQLFNFQDFATIGATGTTINAVQSVISVREDASGTSSNVIRLLGSAASDNTAFNHNTTYATKGRLDVVHPNTGIAWTVANFNSIQMGSVEANSIAMRMDIAYIQIHFTPAQDTKPFFLLTAA